MSSKSFSQFQKSSIRYWRFSIVVIFTLFWTLYSTPTYGQKPTDDRQSETQIPTNDLDVKIYLPTIFSDYTPNDDGDQDDDPYSGDYTPGDTYWGTNQYIEYIAGNLPIIIGAPHAGYLTPDEIPDRTWGTLGGDKGSQEYARLVADHITEITCRYPHVIINRLHRSKIDLNRNKTEGAQGNPLAEQAWEEYHAFIEDAEEIISNDYGKGHYFDFHTNAHEGKWVEMGQLLSPSALDLDDEKLDNSTSYKDRSSIKNLAYNSSSNFSEIVRGSTSLGGLLYARGFKSVPSPAYTSPGNMSFFSGGYNISRHGSHSDGAIDATQVETYWEFRTDNVIQEYSIALAESIVDFLEAHYGFNLRRDSCDDFEQPIINLEIISSDPAIINTSVTLTATISAGTNVSYAWDLGDGSSANGVIVNHEYSAVGSYTAMVTATNSLGSKVATTTVTIEDVPPVAAFSLTPGVADEATSFTNKSTGTNLTYLWDFGDGSTSTEVNPSHVYTGADTYTVTLTVSNGAGSDSTSQQVVIEDALIGGLSVTNDGPTVQGNETNLTVTISSGTNVVYNWDLGDGSTQDDAGPLLSYIYPTTGTFTVTVTAINSVNSDTATTVVMIE